MSARATFAPLAAGQVDHAARTLRDCSLDRVDDHDAQPDNDIARGDKVMLAGWAGDSVTQMVAPSLQIVLQGAQDYAASAPTGYPRRNDVAKFKDIPAFVGSGYAVIADTSAVSPGTYNVGFLFRIGGDSVVCDTSRQVTVH